MTPASAPPHDPATARAAILDRMAAAARAAGRDPAAVTLTAVSKQQPWDRVEPVLAAGQRVFGENRVQEAAERWGERDLPGLELRLIGPLQTNKAPQAVSLFHVIETLDRPKLARALADAAARRGALPRLLVQVNTGSEPQKAGVTPGELPGFLQTLEREYALPVEGLMCIPPAADPPALHFALLAKLAKRHGLPHLSMGMSGDYERAVRLGATSIRVGSALFGDRA